MNWKPCKRNDFIKKLRALGFEGAYSGAKHQFMVFKQFRLTIPSNSEYSIPQLRTQGKPKSLMKFFKRNSTAERPKILILAASGFLTMSAARISQVY